MKLEKRTIHTDNTEVWANKIKLAWIFNNIPNKDIDLREIGWAVHSEEIWSRWFLKWNKVYLLLAGVLSVRSKKHTFYDYCVRFIFKSNLWSAYDICEYQPAACTHIVHHDKFETINHHKYFKPMQKHLHENERWRA